MIPETKKPSIRVRLIAIWLWLNSFYYLFNAIVIASIILIYVSLEIATNGSKFVILQDHYPVILLPLAFSVLAYLYQHNSFKLLTLTRKSFYMSFFLLIGHFFFSLGTILAMNYLLSSLSGENIPQVYSTVVGFNIFLILPVICVVLLGLSIKEFEFLEKKMSGKASISVILFSVIPIMLSLFLIIWGTTELIDTDYNYTKAQNQASFIVYKIENLPKEMYYAVKYNYKADSDEVSFLVSSKKDHLIMISVSQYSTIKKDSVISSRDALSGCEGLELVCSIQEISLNKSKTGMAYFIPHPNNVQYVITYDTKDGTTVLLGFINYPMERALEFIDKLK